MGKCLLSLFLLVFSLFRSLNSTQTFSIPIGRTNTEYYTSFPMYGSNIHSSGSRKPNATAVAANDTVELQTCDREYLYCTYEHINKHFIPKRWKNLLPLPSNTNANNPITGVRENSRDGGMPPMDSTSTLPMGTTGNARSSDLSVSGGNNVANSEIDTEESFNFNSIHGKSTAFRKYIARCEETSVAFEFCVESLSGQARQ